jgi:hypothetical protein
VLSVALPPPGTLTTVGSDPSPLELVVSVAPDGSVVSMTSTVVSPGGTNHWKNPFASVVTVCIPPPLSVMPTSTFGSGVSPALNVPLLSLSR